MAAPRTTNRQPSRIALWLDVDDMRWLIQFLAKDRRTREDTLAEEERAERIRFWALAALHKAGEPAADGNEPDSTIQE